MEGEAVTTAGINRLVQSLPILAPGIVCTAETTSRPPHPNIAQLSGGTTQEKTFLRKIDCIKKKHVKGSKNQQILQLFTYGYKQNILLA